MATLHHTLPIRKITMRQLLIILLFFISLPTSANEQLHYQTYQRLQAKLAANSQAALPEIRAFSRQVERGSVNSRKMAAYLMLQACVDTNKYACALKQTSTLLSLEPEKDAERKLILMKAQLAYQLENYQLAADSAQKWLNFSLKSESESDRATMWSLRAYSLEKLHSPASAESAIRRAIAIEATENRYRFLLSLLELQNKDRESNRLLEKLVNLYPARSEYWERLAYSQLKLGRNEKALLVFDSLYKQQRLPERSLVTLVQLKLEQGAAVSAEQILAQHRSQLIKTEGYHDLYIQSLLLSQQHTKLINYLEANTVSSRNKQLSAQLAFGHQRWQTVVRKLDGYFDNNTKPLSKQDQHLLLIRAMSYVELENWQRAKADFIRLSDTPLATYASQWISQIKYLSENNGSPGH